MTDMASIITYIITAVIVLIVIAAIIALQVFLSTRENKWLGLILPIVAFVLACIISLMIPLFSAASVEYQSYESYESSDSIESVEYFSTELDESVEITYKETLANPVTIIFSTFIVFLVCNIPTVILLLIYLGCRATRKKKLGNNVELNKMSIQDL